MYFFDEKPSRCGFYECSKCSYRFLSLKTESRTSCPLCEQSIDYEIGPDESLEDCLYTAALLDVIEGEENVERMDILLSAAFAEDDSWI